jgi:hypothetical protein
MKNYKTTLSGVLAFVPTILHFVFPKVVTTEVALALTSVLTSLGLLNAKDNNVTGGTIQQ